MEEINNILLCIEEFRKDPYNIDEIKVDKLKDYYYRLFVKDRINVDREDLLIGINKKYNKLLLFRDKHREYPILVLDIEINKYYYKYRPNKKILAHRDDTIKLYSCNNCLKCLVQ